MNAPAPPRRPSRLTWPVLSRLLGRVLAGLALVWVVALVAWPTRHLVVGWLTYDSEVPGAQVFTPTRKSDPIARHYVVMPRDPRHRIGSVEVRDYDSSFSAILGR